MFLRVVTLKLSKIFFSLLLNKLENVKVAKWIMKEEEFGFKTDGQADIYDCKVAFAAGLEIRSFKMWRDKG